MSRLRFEVEIAFEISRFSRIEKIYVFVAKTWNEVFVSELVPVRTFVTRTDWQK